MPIRKASHMPRRRTSISSPDDLTEKEKIVLNALIEFKEEPVTCIELAHFAPDQITQGRGEWAMPALKRLATFGLIEKTPIRLGNRSTWRALTAGIALLQAPPGGVQS